MPNNILFTNDGYRAVVMSRSKVVVLDLETQAITVEYPLTLDADIEIDPSAAVLTPDGRYVLISIEGTNDLYKLDLEVVSIDIVDLQADAEHSAARASWRRRTLRLRTAPHRTAPTARCWRREKRRVRAPPGGTRPRSTRACRRPRA